MKQPIPNPVSAPTGYPAAPVPSAPQIPPQVVPQMTMGAPVAPGQAPQYAPAPQMAPAPGMQPAPMQQQSPYGQPQHAPMQAPAQHAPRPVGMQPGMPAGQPQPGYAPQPGAMPMTQRPMESVIPAPTAEDMKEGGEKALPRIAIHAFCERQETAATIQATTQDWRMARTNVKIYMGGLQAAVEFYHNEGTPGLILFESGMRGPELFSQLDQLASVCDENTKVVMIGAANDIRLYRELIEKGLSDYIVPPFHPLTLIRSLSDLYGDPDKPFVGRVVAFFGAKGGVGSSTIAHNIAWGMAGKLQQETALIDLDSSWGTTGLDFNYDNTQGLEEALADHERLDERLLDRIMVRHTDKLSILPAAASLGANAPTDPAAYETLVDGVRSISPMTILDMPHVWTKWSSQLLVGADDIVITATPDLANLRNTKNLVDFLKAARPNDALPLLILNKTNVPKTAEIPMKEFASAVGLEPALVLPYEPAQYTEAMNEGKMLSEISAGATAFEGMMYLAHRLKTGSFPAPQEKMKKGMLGKVIKPKKPSSSNKKAGGSLFAKLKKRK